MGKGGWIRLHRRILDWEWYTDVNTKVLFMHLLLRASHKPHKWMGMTIEAGQLATGLFALSQETGLSVQNIRTSLNRLKSTNSITIKSTNRFSIITLLGWDRYQSKEVDQQANQQASQQTTNKQLTTNKNVKNVKNTPTGGVEATHANQDINLFIERVNKVLPMKLPVDARTRFTASNAVKMLTRSKGREWLDADMWINFKAWMNAYHATHLSRGYQHQSWYKVYDYLKLWLANNGDVSKLIGQDNATNRRDYRK